MACKREASPDTPRRWLPRSRIFQDFGLNVGDCALGKVNVESQEVEVLQGFQLDGIAEKVVVDQGLYGWMGEEVFVVHSEAVVHIAVV